MFTWICPKCGREVPPSYSECPNCAELAKRAAAPPPPPQYAPAPPQGPPPNQYPPPPPQGYAPPAQYQGQPQQQYAPPPPPPQGYAPPPPQYGPPPGAQVHTIPDPYSQKRGMPGWLATLLVTAGLVAVGFVLYKYVLPSGGAAPVAAEKGEEAKSATTSTHPYAKFVEVAGIRFTEERGKAKLQFIVINHSNGELSDLGLNLTIATTASKPEDAPLTTAAVKVGGLGPWESKELSVPVNTKARAYELPDWQFLKVNFDITGGN